MAQTRSSGTWILWKEWRPNRCFCDGVLSQPNPTMPSYTNSISGVSASSPPDMPVSYAFLSLVLQLALILWVWGVLPLHSSWFHPPRTVFINNEILFHFLSRQRFLKMNGFGKMMLLILAGGSVNWYNLSGRQGNIHEKKLKMHTWFDWVIKILYKDLANRIFIKVLFIIGEKWETIHITGMTIYCIIQKGTPLRVK